MESSFYYEDVVMWVICYLGGWCDDLVLDVVDRFCWLLVCFWNKILGFDMDGIVNIVKFCGYFDFYNGLF